MTPSRPRLLAVVVRFKWVHIDYLAALAEHFEVFVAWSGEGGKGAPITGLREGMRGVPIGWLPDVGVDQVRARLSKIVSTFRPDLVHVMYYNHEDLTVVLRELEGDALPIVFECRDPLTTLTGARPGDHQLGARAFSAPRQQPSDLRQQCLSCVLRGSARG